MKSVTLPDLPQDIAARATGTKLYCLVTGAHVCEQLAQGCYPTAERPGVEPATCRVASRRDAV